MTVALPAPADVDDVVREVMRQYHPELDVVGVVVDALLVYAEHPDLSPPRRPALRDRGYSCAARIKRSPKYHRARGGGDAILEVDAYTWWTVDARTRRALVDHELEHLELATNAHGVRWDAYDRPVLSMRVHDVQFGWFARIAARWGEASLEVAQARRLVSSPTGGAFFTESLRPPRIDLSQLARVEWDPKQLEELRGQVTAAREAVATRKSVGVRRQEMEIQ